MNKKNLLEEAMAEFKVNPDGYLAGVMGIVDKVKGVSPQEWDISPKERVRLYVALGYLEKWIMDNGERVKDILSHYKGKKITRELMDELYLHLRSNDEATAKGSIYIFLLAILHQMRPITSHSFISRLKSFWEHRLEKLNAKLASVKDPVFRDVMMRHAEMWRRVADTQSERERLEFLLGELDKHKERIKELEKQMKVLEEVNKVLKEQTKGKEKGKGKGGGIRMGIADVVRAEDIMSNIIRKREGEVSKRLNELRAKMAEATRRINVFVLGIDIAVEMFSLAIEWLSTEVEYYMIITKGVLGIDNRNILKQIKKSNVVYPADWSDELMLELIRRAKLKIISDLLTENNIPHKFNIETGEFELLTSSKEIKAEIQKNKERLKKDK